MSLTDTDLETVRQLYTEVQNWARHYEQLVVNANVLIVSASLIFVGLAFGEKIKLHESYALLAIPVIMAIIGLVLTLTLFRLYADCIERLVRLEKLLGCDDSTRMRDIDGKGPLVPGDLHLIPVRKPTSVRFFVGLHITLLFAYIGLAIVRVQALEPEQIQPRNVSFIPAEASHERARLLAYEVEARECAAVV